MIGKHRNGAAGDIVYLSDRKLYNSAAQQGIKTGAMRSDVDIEGTAGVQPVLGISAQGTVRTGRSDPGKAERLTIRHLDAVIKRLGAIPNLEAGEAIREGEWFRFHRSLRFGVGHSDAGVQIKALVVTDQEQVPSGISVPGLLMNGSIAHVREPYATDGLRAAPGSRSGSGTERLFNWLDEIRRAQEDDLGANQREILESVGNAPRGGATALEMYGLFAKERWMAPYLTEPLMHGAPCEGVGQASFVAVGEEMTVVMGSPLYIKVRPFTADRNGSGGFLSRIFPRSLRK